MYLNAGFLLDSGISSKITNLKWSHENAWDIPGTYSHRLASHQIDQFTFQSAATLAFTDAAKYMEWG